jgi:hypothetical protein
LTGEPQVQREGLTVVDQRINPARRSRQVSPPEMSFSMSDFNSPQCK